LENFGLARGTVSGYWGVGGLVGLLDGGTVSNSYATDAVTGEDWVGGLAGYIIGGTVSNSYATGAVSGRGIDVGGLVGAQDLGIVSNCYATGAVTGEGWLGGLVGLLVGGTVSNSYATGAVSGGPDGYYVGGVVGYQLLGAICNSYATGAVSGGWKDIGGLVGFLDSGTVSNSYATGAVSGGSDGYYVGGLVGYLDGGTVSNSYAVGSVSGSRNVGGIVGYTTGTPMASSSYYDTQTTGQTTSAGGIGKTTAEMRQEAAFGGWEFASVWGIVNGLTYPYLLSQPSGAIIAATDASASEIGPDTGTFTVYRTGSTAGDLVVNYALGGTAWNVLDYATLSGALTLGAGETSGTIVVTPVDDAGYEAPETVIITLSTSGSYVVGSPVSDTVTIADNDTLDAAHPLGTYVIITTSAIEAGSNQLDAFAQHKEELGYDVSLVTETSWGGGIGDQAAENIRGWLLSNYQGFSSGPDGRQPYVLLVGNPDPVQGEVPMKMMYSYATVSNPDPNNPSNWYPCPSDTYYAALSFNWDGNGNGLCGQWGRTPVGDGIYWSATESNLPSSNVLVGRIPVYGGDLGEVAMFLGNGSRGFSQAGSFDSDGINPRAISVADFNGDSKSDLVTANYASNNVSILLGNGDGTFAAAITFDSGGAGPDSVVSADFNGDGKNDLAVANNRSNNVAILLGNGNGQFSGAICFVSGGPSPSSLAVGDFNGDGKSDLVVANSSGNNVGLLLGNGDGTFAGVVTFNPGGERPGLRGGGGLQRRRQDRPRGGQQPRQQCGRAAGQWERHVPGSRHLWIRRQQPQQHSGGILRLR
jgi:hypothetical protein